MLYTAGMDDRKNFQACSARGARLPAAVRDALAARDGVQHGRPDAQPPRAPRARGRASSRGCCCPGFVPDAVLRLLYQSTDLFVFPSLYEGYGLPVAEALACGARTIGSGTSSVAELLVPEAQFDPGDDDAIAAAIERALTDDATRRDARRAGARAARRAGTRSPTASPTRTSELLARPRPGRAPPAAASRS